MSLFTRASVCAIGIAVLVAGGDRLVVSAQHAAPASLTTPLIDPTVNTPDSGLNDSQVVTAVVAASNDTVITAYLNTALNNGSNFHQVGWSRTTTGGASWTDGGALPPATGGEFGSPALARDAGSGKIYLAVSTFTGTSALPVYTSTNDGQSWNAPVNAMPGFTGGDRLVNPRLAVDNFPGPGQGDVYAVAFNNAGGGAGSKAAGIYLSVSTDGGATFTVSPGPLQLIGGVPQVVSGPTVVVGTDHAVYVFWFANQQNSPQIRFAKSTNLGQSFAANTVAIQLTGSAGGDLGLEFGTNSWPQVVVSPSSGALIIAYNDKNGPDRGDIFIGFSENGGANWDPRNPVNSDHYFGGLHDQFTPSIAMTPDGRHLLVSWYDRRSDPANAWIERWGLIVTFGNPLLMDSAALSPNFRISTGAWPAVFGQDALLPATFMTLYDGTSADNNYFYAAWSDNRLGHGAHTHQPDVRVARIPVWAPTAFDLDRDRLADRTVFRPGTGTWYSSLSWNGFSAVAWGQNGDIDVPGDYDSDGVTDQAVFRPATGAWYVRGSSGATDARIWGQSGDVPLAGDVDGYGQGDFTVWRPGTGVWYLSLPEQSLDFAIAWGQTGDVPRLADFDGDGAKDLVVYRPADGVWWIYFPRYQTYTSIRWGNATDIPVPGDFDGDGKADAAVFRAGTGTWYVRRSTDGSLLAMNWGLAGDIPIVSDFDADGKADFTVFRPSNGVWYTSYSSGGFAALPWGMNGDQPSGR